MGDKPSVMQSGSTMVPTPNWGKIVEAIGRMEGKIDSFPARFDALERRFDDQSRNTDRRLATLESKVDELARADQKIADATAEARIGHVLEGREMERALAETVQQYRDAIASIERDVALLKKDRAKDPLGSTKRKALTALAMLMTSIASAIGGGAISHSIESADAKKPPAISAPAPEESAP